MELREARAQYLVAKGVSCPLGYKQTEVGVIPEDWKVSCLADVAIKIQDGTHFSPKLGGNDYLYITSKNIRRGYVDLSKVERISAEEHKKIYKRCDVKYGDLLLTKDGASTGNAAINSIKEEFSLLSSVALLRFDPAKYETVYFLQQMLSHDGQQRITEAMSGNAITRLTLDKINKLVYPVPPTKTEQTAIANALSDVDGLIQSLTRLIAKKHQIKQGAMQTLLNPYENGRLKEGWEETPLRDVSYMKGRIGWQGLKQTEFTMNEDEPFLITGMNFKDGEIRWNEVYHISNERYEIAKDIQLKPNDVLMTKDGTIGKLLYVNEVPYPGKASLNSHLLVFRPIRNSYDPKFLYYQLLSKVFRDYVELSKSGSTFFGMSQEAVGNYPFKYPKLEEQTRIATILSDMDAEIATLETKLAKYQQIKQGMMQNLLTGRIRLIKPEAKAEAAA